jgi:hypothetical protein
VTQLKNLFVLGEATKASVCNEELWDEHSPFYYLAMDDEGESEREEVHAGCSLIPGIHSFLIVFSALFMQTVTRFYIAWCWIPLLVTE